MNLKSWLVALFLAGAAVAGGNYVYNRGAIEQDLNSENLGISAEDLSVNLSDIERIIAGIKNAAVQLKNGISNIIDEYIDRP
jgi:hypothetical protein